MDIFGFLFFHMKNITAVIFEMSLRLSYLNANIFDIKWK